MLSSFETPKAVHYDMKREHGIPLTCMPDLSGGKKFSFPTLFDFYREVFLNRLFRATSRLSRKALLAVYKICDVQSKSSQKKRFPKYSVFFQNSFFQYK